MQTIKPAVVAHCDWGKDQKKRWMSVAIRRGGNWHIGMPELVGDTRFLFDGLRGRSESDGPVFLGFDFPIGLPLAYGKLTKLGSFKDALHAFGKGSWGEWYNVAENAGEIDIRRPFYPMRPGGTKRHHLYDALGVTDGETLLRLCDRATPDRQAACCLFWTLGGNQVGKGAITGWREIIVPNLGQLGLWPFDGTLAGLFREKEIVVAETYPGDVYGQLGIPRTPPWSKRKQAGRRDVSPYILDWFVSRPTEASQDLLADIRTGFGEGSAGEDPFDALIGLLGMLDVVDERRAEGAPNLPQIGTWEGWIIGQEATYQHRSPR